MSGPTTGGSAARGLGCRVIGVGSSWSRVRDQEQTPMRGMKPSLMLAALAVVGLALWAGAYVDQTGSQMATAANRFLAALDKNQVAKATYPFDAPERLDWHFIPRERKGLPVKDMTSAQRALAFGLIHSGLAGSGYL